MLASARPAQAGNDGDVVLGADNQSTGGTTGVQSSSITGLHGRSTASSGTGVFGEDLATGGIGVHGTGSNTGVKGDGYYGLEGSGTTGVSGVCTDPQGGYGIVAENFQGGFGVFAQVGDGTAILASCESGTAVDARNHGVSGSAVSGSHDGGGDGVTGQAYAGTGVHAVSGNGTALHVEGKAIFSRSGIAVVPSGSNHVKVTLARVTTATMILATVQQSGGFWVKYVVPASGAFTIYLSKAPSSPTTVKVAYLVLN
jgi:hypothetical protein